MSTTDTAAQAAQTLFTDVSAGWQRWDSHLVDATRPATQALLSAVGITSEDVESLANPVRLQRSS